MEAAAGQSAEGRQRLARVLAGIHVGVLAGFAVLTWVVLVSLISGESPWRVPNLMASVFFGPQALRGEFGRITLAGISLFLLQCAGAAVLFSFWMPSGGYRRPILTAMAYTAALGWVANSFVWKSLYPFLPTMLPRFSIWTGFAFFGLALCFIPWFRRKLEDEFLLK